MVKIELCCGSVILVLEVEHLVGNFCHLLILAAIVRKWPKYYNTIFSVSVSAVPMRRTGKGVTAMRATLLVQVNLNYCLIRNFFKILSIFRLFKFNCVNLKFRTKIVK